MISFLRSGVETLLYLMTKKLKVFDTKLTVTFEVLVLSKMEMCFGIGCMTLSSIICNYFSLLGVPILRLVILNFNIIKGISCVYKKKYFMDENNPLSE